MKQNRSLHCLAAVLVASTLSVSAQTATQSTQHYALRKDSKPL